MGLLDIFSVSSTQPQNSIDKGREAFKYFHNQSSKYPAYTYSYDQALALVATNGGIENQSDKITSIFLDGLGGAIESVQSSGLFGGGGVQSAMEALADKSQGQLPTASSFFSAIGNAASNPSFITIAEAVVPDVAGQVVTGVAAVGSSLISTGKILTYIFPVVAVGAILFIVTARTKELAGK